MNIKKTVTRESNKLIFLLRRLFDSLTIRHLIHLFSIPQFESEIELQFWHQLHSESQVIHKKNLLVGAICILPLVALVCFNNGLSKNEIIAYLFTISTLGFLFLSLNRPYEINNKANKALKLVVLFLLVNLFCFVLVKGNTAFYHHMWVGLLPIYFLTYGQLLMSISEATKFGLLSMLSLLMSGYIFGIDSLTLLPSLIILLIANSFGFSTRYQLEILARNAFMERRKAKQSSLDHNLFFRQFSHNLRQPLNALSCYASILDAAFTNNQNQQDEKFQRMSYKLGLAIDDLNCTFNRILDITDLETGRQIPNLMAVDINLLLVKLEKQFCAQATKRNLKLRVHLRTKPPYIIYSDPGILNQILGSMIDNAIKYTQTGWVVIAAVKTNHNQLKVHVRDSGIGIDEEHHTAIFKEFFRCQNLQINEHGLGIGLAYVIKALNCLPNHNLQVYSRLNRGSDFQLCLPILKTGQPM